MSRGCGCLYDCGDGCGVGLSMCGYLYLIYIIMICCRWGSEGGEGDNKTIAYQYNVEQIFTEG